MLKNKNDVRSLVFILLNVVLVYLGMVTQVSWLSPFLIAALVFSCYLSLNINHNLLHVTMFQWSPFNIATNVILSVCVGIPVSVIYYPHVVNHHPNPCSDKDWTGAYLVQGLEGLPRIILYVIRANLSILRHRPDSFFEGLNRERSVSLVFESSFLVVFLVIVFYLSPVRFLAHVLIPWFLSQGILVFMNFLLHDGCVYDSKDRHSRSFKSNLLNYFLLNGGYHLAHHLNPTLHWSELNTYHQEIIDSKKNVQDLTHQSLWSHTMKFYFSSKR